MVDETLAKALVDRMADLGAARSALVTVCVGPPAGLRPKAWWPPG